MSEEKKLPTRQADIPAENSEEEIINSNQENIAQYQTQNYPPPTDNMEVHKHPHHVTHKKKWGEYLLEFFMLFLAVFLGFVAENWREHSVEKRNAKDYLEAYRNDLIRNQQTIDNYYSTYLKLLPVYDSITNIFFTNRENLELAILARLLNIGKRNILTQVSTPTYVQLLNSGSLKNIRMVAIRDSMAVYYDKLNILRDYDLRMIQLKNAMYPEILKIEDLHSFWRTDIKDPENMQILPDMLPYDTLTGGQRRLMINYYRQFFIQMRSNHRSLKSIMNTNKNLVSMIDEEIEK
jgi:hypothetical protein